MRDLDKARKLFTGAGLAFPKLPEALASALVEREDWVFSTHALTESPYRLEAFVEADAPEADSVVLAHTGEGTNAFAVQYYLVHRGLRLFLHLGWGGAYMDADEATAQVKQCFATADRIVAAAAARLGADEGLTIVVSGLHGSRWAMSEDRAPSLTDDARPPSEVLADCLAWLEQRPTKPGRR